MVKERWEKSVKKKLKRYKLDSLKLSVQGAYENQEKAIKDLSDQLLSTQKCMYPRVCIGVILKVKIDGWNKVSDLRIYPFKEEHWKPLKGFIPKPCEFRYD